jgi:putative radical SAM enzyme (TIGR03279 family)
MGNNTNRAGTGKCRQSLQDLSFFKANHTNCRRNDMEKPDGALIKEIVKGSIAAELELEPGDRVLSVNEEKLTDYIDLLRWNAEEELTLVVRKQSGEVIEFEVEKESEEPLGFIVAEVVFDGIRTCSNQCLFCFVHQLPQGQRRSLYIRDDDYRLSFLHGCYITLTNLTEEDWLRIERLHLSPLYISVHATDPEIRCKLLGSPRGGQIMTELRRLADSGITLHTQAVICPGLNDGLILERTISDLAGLYPAVNSLAVVPVGLTGHRGGLYPLRTFTPDEAAQILDRIAEFQKKFYDNLDTRFVFAADEWYLSAGREFPDEPEYEGFPQLDNGVGLIRWFWEEFSPAFAERVPRLKGIRLDLAVLTGRSAVAMWRKLIPVFREYTPGIRLEILPVENRFFGRSVTVTGLLTGSDLARSIREDYRDGDPLYLIPRITLKQGENLFLDGVTTEELQALIAPKRLAIVPTRAAEWLEWIIEEGCG